MRHIQIIGKPSVNLTDFFLQWGLRLSEKYQVALNFLEHSEFQVFSGENNTELNLDSLHVYSGVLRMEDDADVLISLVGEHSSDFTILFLEQNLGSWLYVKKVIEERKIQPQLVLYWDFQVERYNESYWKKALLSEVAMLEKVSDFAMTCKYADVQNWLKNQLRTDLSLKNFSRSHLKQFDYLTSKIEPCATGRG